MNKTYTLYVVRYNYNIFYKLYPPSNNNVHYKNKQNNTESSSSLMVNCNRSYYTNPSALVQTDINGPFELHVRGLGELECPEFRGQKISVYCVEVLEQVWIHRTAWHRYENNINGLIRPVEGRPYTRRPNTILYSLSVFNILCGNLPVEYDGLFLRFGVRHLHVANQQPVNRGTVFVQIYFHLQRSAGVNVEFAVYDTAALAYTHLEHGNRSVFRQRSSYLQVPAR